MTKRELIKEIHKENNYNYVDVESIINQTFDKLASALEVEDKIVISGFGTFEKYYQEGYSGINPATGEKIQVDGNYKIRFSVSKKIKANLNNKN